MTFTRILSLARSFASALVKVSTAELLRLTPMRASRGVRAAPPEKLMIRPQCFARMSGTAYGTIVLHVTPDAASGGLLGLVRNGDRIKLSVKERRIDLLVDDAELRRRAASRTGAAEAPPRGYAALYAREILGADQGCDFRFLTPR